MVTIDSKRIQDTLKASHWSIVVKTKKHIVFASPSQKEVITLPRESKELPAATFTSVQNGTGFYSDAFGFYVPSIMTDMFFNLEDYFL